MALEIEHKYLVINNSYINLAYDAEKICQGYLNRTPERTVRVRTRGDKGFLTVKGKNSGDSRLEFEYEIPFDDARQMLELCEHPLLLKTRYLVNYCGMKWEIDVYHGKLEGLAIAEIELPTSDTPYSLPPFAGENVTGNPKYYNSNL